MSYHDAEDTLATLDRQTREAVERARSAQAFRARSDQMRGTAGSGGIRVSVDASGALVDLELPRELGHQSGTALARLILKAVREAHADVARQVADAAAEAFGEDSAATRQVRAELDRRGEVIQGGGYDDNVLR